MSGLDRCLKDKIEEIIVKQLYFLMHYNAQVVDTADRLNKGRVKVTVQDLGFSTPDVGFWAWPRQSNMLIVPKIGDWIEIYFENGDRDRPVYLGKAPEQTGNTPVNYTGNPLFSILFESQNNKAQITFDEVANTMNIGNSNFLAAARKTDATISNSSTDSAFWVWMASFTTMMTSLAADLATGTLVSMVAAGAVITAWLAASPAPTSQTGQINAGSNQINIGGQ